MCVCVYFVIVEVSGILLSILLKLLISVSVPYFRMIEIRTISESQEKCV